MKNTMAERTFRARARARPARHLETRSMPAAAPPPSAPLLLRRASFQGEVESAKEELQELRVRPLRPRPSVLSRARLCRCHVVCESAPWQRCLSESALGELDCHATHALYPILSQERHAHLLEMFGEKDEQLESALMDLEDIKGMYKELVNTKYAA